MREPDDPLVERARAGEPHALVEMLTAIELELLRFVSARLDRSLRRRVDPEDVVQQILLEVVRRAEEWKRQTTYTFGVWVRLVAAQSLDELRRRHLSAQRRDARREQGLESSRGGGLRRLPADQTSPSSAARREELRERIERALERLGPADREILGLRHMEGLSNEEAAARLGLEPPAASKRFQRAIERLGQQLRERGEPRG